MRCGARAARGSSVWATRQTDTAALVAAAGDHTPTLVHVRVMRTLFRRFERSCKVVKAGEVCTHNAQEPSHGSTLRPSSTAGGSKGGAIPLHGGVGSCA